MKITFICTKKEEGNGAHGGGLWTYHFGVKKVSEDMAVQKTFGNLVLSFTEPQHYKRGQEYTIMLSSLISLGDKTVFN